MNTVPLCRVILSAFGTKYDTVPIDVRLSLPYGRQINSEECILFVPLYLVLAVAHRAKNASLPYVAFFVNSSLFSSGHLGRRARGIRYNCRIYISYSEEILLVFLEQVGADHEFLSRLIRGIDTPFDINGLMETRLVELVVCVVETVTIKLQISSFRICLNV